MIKRSVSILLVAAQVVLGVPVYADTSPAPPAVTVNRTVPAVEPVPLEPQFSNPATAAEIVRARVFGEPVVPVGGDPTSEENSALAQALTHFRQGFGATRYAALESFVVQHAASPWRASVLANLAQSYRRDGFYTRSLLAAEQAWTLAKEDTSLHGRAVGDAAIANLLDVNLQFGRQAEAERLLAEIEGREVGGAAFGSVLEAREALWVLANHHDMAVASGPLALWRFQARKSGERSRHPALEAFHATPQGASMKQIKVLSDTVGLGLTPAYRQGAAPVPIPSVAHLKAGHFTAVVGENATHYKLDDAILGGETWVTKQALADEGSGYFLIPGELPSGWRVPTEQELTAQRGKCKAATHEVTTGPVSCGECAGGGGKGGGRGMATYSFDAHRVSLLIYDTPVGYDPPRGPAVNFGLGYNHLQALQPETLTYSNVGRPWNYDWLAFVEDNPSNLAASVHIYLRGGGIEAHKGYDGVSSYQPQRDTQTVLVRTSISPIRYERRLPNGGVEIYSQSDGATSPRRVFLTKVVDPQGQSIDITFDSRLRVVAVTDAIGQVTTLEYGMTSDPLKITKVTDPFGRSARLEYDQSGRLFRIIDVIGMVSQFEYGSPAMIGAGGPFIRSLITPYGRTTFVWGAGLGNRWLQATDPLGGKERVEFRYTNAPGIPESDPANTVPPGFGPNAEVNDWGSYYWDKRTMALYPGDLTKATHTKWAFWGTLGITNHPLSKKRPLENRVWYAYAGNVGDGQIGPLARPAKIGRVLDDGSAKIQRLEYNDRGHPTRYTDPAGRETLFEYDPTGIDLLNVKQKNGGAYERLVSATYNTKHQPTSITDAAGNVTDLTFSTNGNLLTVVTPAIGSLTLAERRTTLEYFLDTDPDGPGRVKKITGPTVGSGGPVGDLTYDGYGRVRTATDVSESRTITLDYDALDRTTKVTYPDSTYEEIKYHRLDAEQMRDRLGRWTHVAHDALRRATSVRDPLGRAVSVEWCACGGPDKLIDGNGNATTRTRDLRGRVTRETRADNTYVDYTYETTTSRLKQIKDPKNQYTNLLYFVDDRLKEISFTGAVNATPTVSYTYDAAYGRPLTMTDGTGTTTYAYHPIAVPPATGAGRLASIDGPVANDTISYTYDALGRAYQESINGTSASATFDALGRVSKITNVLGDFTYNYVGLTGRVDDVTYPNGQITDLSYLPASQEARLEEIHHKKPGGATLSKFRYAYDASGRIKTWTQQADSNPAKAFDLTYDSADQLVSATLRTTDPTPTPVKRYVYGYDKAGNRTSEQIDDVVTQAAHNNANQLTSQTPGGALRFAGDVNEPATVTVQAKPAAVSAANKFDGSAAVGSGTTIVEVKATDPAGNVATSNYQVSQSGSTKTLTYDANGNLTGDGTRTYEWDARDQLIAINQGTHRTELTYDGAGRRTKIVEKESGVAVGDRRFLWSATDIAEERDSTNAVVKRFLGDGLQQGGTAYYLTADHLGSVRELSDGTGVDG